MGEMTASVAHELNQPLTAIANNASAARRFLERGNIDPGLLATIAAGHGGRQPTRRRSDSRNSRAGARRTRHRAQTLLNLNAVIADTVRLVSSDILMRESVVTTEMDQQSAAGAKRLRFRFSRSCLI